MEIESNIIFFLSNNSKLPRWYINLSKELNKQSIQLVPIQHDQLDEILKSEDNVHLITYEVSLSDRKLMSGKIFRVLKSGLKSRKIKMYGISSFGMNMNYIPFKRDNRYHFYELPIGFDILSKKIALAFLESKKDSIMWPGGRKSGFPEFGDS